MDNQIIFVHIPKTAGTSFRIACTEELPADRLLFDYGPNADETSKTLKETIYKDGFTNETTAFRESEICFISGHFTDTKIDLGGYATLFPEADIVTFVRDPIKRAVSEFYHFRDRFNYKSGIDEFIRNPSFINRQHKALCGLSLTSCSFIGLTERYEESVTAFNARFGTSVRCVTVNRRNASKERIQLNDEDIEAFCILNLQDIEIYNLAVSRYWAGARHTTTSGRRLSRYKFAARRTPDGGIVGWVVDYDILAPVRVIVVVDGRDVLSRPASLYRPDTVKAGLHSTGYCGFKIDHEDLAVGVGGKREFSIRVPGFGTIYEGVLAL